MVEKSNNPETKSTLNAAEIAIKLPLIILFTVFIFIATNFYYDLIPFLTKDFEKCLPWINLSIGVSFLENIIGLFLKGKIIQTFLDVLSDPFTLLSNLSVLIVFPFDFGIVLGFTRIDEVVKIILIIITVAISIGIIVNVIKLIYLILKALFE